MPDAFSIGLVFGLGVGLYFIHLLIHLYIDFNDMLDDIEKEKHDEPRD